MRPIYLFGILIDHFPLYLIHILCTTICLYVQLSPSISFPYHISLRIAAPYELHMTTVSIVVIVAVALDVDRASKYNAL